MVKGITRFICDGCGEIHDSEDTGLPGGWLAMGVDNRPAAPTFCSYSCLQGWIDREKAKKKEGSEIIKGKF